MGPVNAWLDAQMKFMEVIAVLTPQFAENNKESIDCVREKLQDVVTTIIESLNQDYRKELLALFNAIAGALERPPHDVVTIKMESDVNAALAAKLTVASESITDLETNRLDKFKPSALVSNYEIVRENRKAFVRLVVLASRIAIRAWSLSISQFVDGKRKDKELDVSKAVTDDELVKVGQLLFMNGDAADHHQLNPTERLSNNLGFTFEATLPNDPICERMTVLQGWFFRSFKKCILSRLQPMGEQLGYFALALQNCQYRMPNFEQVAIDDVVLSETDAMKMGLEIVNDQDKKKKLAAASQTLEKFLNTFSGIFHEHPFVVDVPEKNVNMTAQFIILAPLLAHATAIWFDLQTMRKKQSATRAKHLEDLKAYTANDAKLADEVILFYQDILKDAFATDAHQVLEYGETVSRLKDLVSLTFPMEFPMSKGATLVRDDPNNQRLLQYVDCLKGHVVQMKHDLVAWYCSVYGEFAEIGVLAAAPAEKGLLVYFDKKDAAKIDGKKVLAHATDNGHVKLSKEAWLAHISPQKG
jgi:hypothetical protein